MDLAQFDWTLYWFMFPVAMCIATTAMLSGIGGAAMFAPIFMIIFPILGPEYPFEGIAAAIGVALLTEVFGFSSGFVGYYRKKLIDFKGAIPFILVGVPVGIVGAILLNVLSDYEEVLRGSYALLMLVLSYVIIKVHEPKQAIASEPAADSVGAAAVSDDATVDSRELRSITGADGTNATAVETLNRESPLPPVPHTSIQRSPRSNARQFSCRTRQNPTTSSAVSPFSARATRSSATSSSPVPPSSMVRRQSADSNSVIEWPALTLAIHSEIIRGPPVRWTHYPALFTAV